MSSNGAQVLPFDDVLYRTTIALFG